VSEFFFEPKFYVEPERNLKILGRLTVAVPIKMGWARKRFSWLWMSRWILMRNG